ncbi:(Dimethylallyl)adenosine tRNA methylthiotransferase miaB domain protein, partial [Mycobacterium xenopi 4042]
MSGLCACAGQVAQVAVELVVGVFPDGARVEHHHVGVG